MRRKVILFSVMLLSLAMGGCFMKNNHRTADGHSINSKIFKAERVEYSTDMYIGASVKEVFPLLCPKREDDWIPGWKEMTTILWSESGFAEEGAVFQTNHDGIAETWVISQFEPMKKIKFVRQNPHVVTILSIDVTEDAGKTKATWTQSQVALSELGNDHVSSQSYKKYDESIKNMEEMLNYYLKTGTMISHKKH